MKRNLKKRYMNKAIGIENINEDNGKIYISFRLKSTFSRLRQEGH